ncbi:hypothetical protein HSX11_09525 [Oxalobacteraceae bacterium]|nr:hypothetical protein [Oxalobacteraceae bacterium]
MRTSHLLLRIYGEKTDEQWSLINLEFSLAAQADTLEEARRMLESQIKEYVHDALVGEDREYARELLTERRAPAKYWFKYWLGLARCRWLGHAGDREQAFTEPLPLVPA